MKIYPESEEMGKIRMNFWIPKNMYQFLHYISSEDGRSMSDVLREAMRDYINKYEENKLKESEKPWLK